VDIEAEENRSRRLVLYAIGFATPIWLWTVFASIAYGWKSGLISFLAGVIAVPLGAIALDHIEDAPVTYSLADGCLTRTSRRRTGSIEVNEIAAVGRERNPRTSSKLPMIGGYGAGKARVFTIYNEDGARELLHELGRQLAAIDSPALDQVEARRLLGLES
jgi:hypothetical protein